VVNGSFSPKRTCARTEKRKAQVKHKFTSHSKMSPNLVFAVLSRSLCSAALAGYQQTGPPCWVQQLGQTGFSFEPPRPTHNLAAAPLDLLRRDPAEFDVCGRQVFHTGRLWSSGVRGVHAGSFSGTRVGYCAPSPQRELRRGGGRARAEGVVRVDQQKRVKVARGGDRQRSVVRELLQSP